MYRESKLNSVIAYLNKRFNQDSEEYCIFNGAKQQVIRFDKDTAISIWACGAIVCIGDQLSFIEEDDGHWFSREYVDSDGLNEFNFDYRMENYTKNGMLSGFSLAWAESFIKAMADLDEYVKENGEPYYYSFGKDSKGNTIYSDTICGYVLK